MPRLFSRLAFASAVLVGLTAHAANPINEPESAGFQAIGDDGRILNLNFEKGDLTDWTAKGDAWEKQPVKGDLDTVRGPGQPKRALPTGDYWIGGYEINGDVGQGTLSSVPFLVTHPWCSFLVGGGKFAETRVEIVVPGRDGAENVFFRVSGADAEEMRPVVVDVSSLMGRRVFIRLVDKISGGWGHVNFDDFRFYTTRPKFKQPELKPTALVSITEVYPYEGLTAEQAAKVMQVPQGFKVQVAAAEPDIAQPIAMCIDDRGRLWVVEAHSYPKREKEGEGKDRILIFEDTDLDGTLDKRTVFIEKLNLVSGIEVGFGGVWVGAAPYLMFIPDKNGNDVPDGLEPGVPQDSEPNGDVPNGAVVLLDGWHYEDTHETLNAFIWGPDGWLYGCHGVFTYSVVGKPGTPDKQRTPINAGIWRYHPTRHVFEVFAEGTSNPWGVDFDEHGQAFCTACVIPHLYYLFEGGRYQRQAGKHFNPYTYDDIKTIAKHRHYVGNQWNVNDRARSDDLGGGHAHAGAMIYQGGSWPAEYRGKLFMHNIHGNRVNVDVLTQQGSGFVGDRNPDFLLTGDKWSQMINLMYGPDGQVWMIDWYDANQCHRPEEGAHDRTNGRIYRVAYNNAKPVKVDLQKLSNAELATNLGHANEWYVRHSRRILQERAAAGQIPEADLASACQTLAGSGPVDKRLRALWLLHVTRDKALLSNEDVTKLLGDSDPWIRSWMIHSITERTVESLPLSGDRERSIRWATAPSRLPALARLAQAEPSPVVRLSLASLAQVLPPGDRWEILAGLTSHSEDAADHNLPLMYWYAMEPLAAADPQRALALAVSAGEHIPILQEYMIRRLGSGDPTKTLDLLAKGLDSAKDSASRLTFLRGINGALRGRKDLAASDALATLGDRFKDDADPLVRVEAHAASMRYQNATAADALRSAVADPSLSTDVRRAALRFLVDGRDKKLASVLKPLLGDPALRRDAIRAIASDENADAADQLVAAYAGLTPDERRDALGTLAARPSYASRLLKAVQSNNIPKTELSADLVRQLRNLNDAELSKQLEQVWGVVRETPADRAALLAKYTALVTKENGPPRDREHGRAIFAKTCQQCHTLFGTGGKVGPDLTGSNRVNTEYLLSNIVDPSAVMAKEYRPSIFALADGRTITGIIKDETGPIYTVQTANELITFPKDDVELRKESELSMMPDDQLKNFSDAEIRALVAYLQGAGQVPLKATAANITGFFNGQDLTNWFSLTEQIETGAGRQSPEGLSWNVEDGEIVGRSTKGLRKNEFLVSQYELGDFRFECEVKLVDNKGNSGIQLRSVPLENGEMKGYQADIGAGWWGKLYEESARGLLENNDAEKYAKKGEWNRYEIVAVGSRVQTFINGNLCVDRDDPAAARRGVLALQLHSGGPTEVRFRKLNVTLLEPNPADDRLQPPGGVSEVVVMATGAAPAADASGAPTISFEKTVLDNVFRSEGVCIADFNNDGLRDIAGGTQIFFQSKGKDGKPRWTRKVIAEKSEEYPSNVYSHSFMNWAEDLNNDGRLDLLVVDFPGTPTWWFENPGQADGPRPGTDDPLFGPLWKKHEITPVTNNESPQYVDVEADGRRELLLGYEAKTMGFAYPKSFPDAVWKLSPISQPGVPGTDRFSHGLGLGDLNGDGRKDVCIIQGWWEQPAEASDAPWRFHDAPFGKPCSQMYVYDFDGDGDNDVLSASAHDYGIWWHENLGKGEDGELAWKTHEIDKTFSETHAVVLADINGDGLPDFITGKRWHSHSGNGPGGDEPAVLRWFELKREQVTEPAADGRTVTKTVPKWIKHEIDEDSGVGTQFDVGDINGDGLLDIAISNKKGSFVFLQKRQ
ncbi:MAG TPA: PVC-type heme-binding CxxCH protein [Caulifigura sp.]|nr:PVC-type heme-binding CxxCH protein [Caulifigura sp.]